MVNVARQGWMTATDVMVTVMVRAVGRGWVMLGPAVAALKPTAEPSCRTA
jgi:hypothetical protein